MVLVDHRLGHGPITPQRPGLALLQGCGEPPANPLHRLGQLQLLGVKEPPRPAGVGGIDDHRPTGRHRGLQALQQHGADFIPGALDASIAKQLRSDHIGGEHQARAAIGPLEQGRQLVRQGGFATAGRANQQVAAQGSAGHGSILQWDWGYCHSLLRITGCRSQEMVAIHGPAANTGMAAVVDGCPPISPEALIGSHRC